LKKINFALSVLIFLTAFYLCAETKTKFTQKIEWKADPNALEYKVELRSENTGQTEFFTTDKSFISFTKAAGIYSYRIFAYDFLGRESSVSVWNTFTIKKAIQPKAQKLKEEVTITQDSGLQTQIPVDLENISESSKIEVLDIKNNEKIPASIVFDGGNKEKTSAKKIQVENLKSGDYKIIVTNPGGLSSQIQQSIKVKDLKSLAEEKRIEEEKLAVERAERERLAEEKRLEEERLAAEQAERERVAEEKRLEEEKLAAEQAERERLAEEKRLEEETKKSQKIKKVKTARSAKDIYFTFGAGLLIEPVNGPLEDFASITEILEPHFGIMFLPFRTKDRKLKFGFENRTVFFSATDKKNYADVTLQGFYNAFNLVLHKNLVRNTIYGELRAGAGLLLMERDIKYFVSDVSNPSSKKFGYIGFQGGGGIMFVSKKYLSLEIATDCSYNRISGENVFLINPYISFGLRL